MKVQSFTLQPSSGVIVSAVEEKTIENVQTNGKHMSELLAKITTVELYKSWVSHCQVQQRQTDRATEFV